MTGDMVFYKGSSVVPRLLARGSLEFFKHYIKMGKSTGDYKFLEFDPRIAKKIDELIRQKTKR